MINWLKHIFTHKWIEKQHDGPYSLHECDKCSRRKMEDLILGQTTYWSR